MMGPLEIVSVVLLAIGGWCADRVEWRGLEREVS
jgi:hypothetical protein